MLVYRDFLSPRIFATLVKNPTRINPNTRVPPRVKFVCMTTAQKRSFKSVAEPVDGSVAQRLVLRDIENESPRHRVIPLPVNCFINVKNAGSFYNAANALQTYTFVKNGSALTV